MKEELKLLARNVDALLSRKTEQRILKRGFYLFRINHRDPAFFTEISNVEQDMIRRQTLQGTGCVVVSSPRAGQPPPEQSTLNSSDQKSTFRKKVTIKKLDLESLFTKLHSRAQQQELHMLIKKEVNEELLIL